MLRDLKILRGYKLYARDGEIGETYDFYFDDRTWIIRYLVADTGSWLSSRRILISPVALGQPSWEKKTLPVNLTQEQVEKSPGIDVDKPVFRQNEKELIQYYNWPNYWEAIGTHIPETAVIMSSRIHLKEGDKEEVNPHLRSTREVNGYHIQARNGEIGHIEEFIVDDNSWYIRYAVVDTKNWLPWGKKILLSTHWIDRIKYDEKRVYVDLTRELIEKSPEFDPSQPVNREYENRIYDFYGRPKYWE